MTNFRFLLLAALCLMPSLGYGQLSMSIPDRNKEWRRISTDQESTTDVGVSTLMLEPNGLLRSTFRIGLSKSEDAVLRAAALRVKAEGEVDAARSREGSEVPPDLLREARTTLSHVTELDHVFSELVGAQGFSGGKNEDVRQWMRTRLRLLHAASALWLELDRRPS